MHIICVFFLQSLMPPKSPKGDFRTVQIMNFAQFSRMVLPPWGKSRQGDGGINADSNSKIIISNYVFYGVYF